MLWRPPQLILNSDTLSIEETEPGDSEVDTSIAGAEVTEVVQKLLGGKAPVWTRSAQSF